MKKFSRPLCLFLSLIILFTFFAVPSSAAENLVSSNLRSWNNLDSDYTLVTYISGLGNVIYSRAQQTDNAENLRVKSTHIFSLADFVSGHSYTFSFRLEDLETIQKYSASTTWDHVYGGLVDGGGVYVIGLASYLSEDNRLVVVDNAYVTINKDNYLDFFGKESTITFELSNLVNPCILISYYEVSSRSSTTTTVINNISLVDNTKLENDNFFSRLFEWFQDRFDDLSTWFSNLGDRIYGFFVDLADSIEEGLNGLLDGIGGWFQKLGNLILYLTWSDEVPDNPFQSEDGPLDKVEGFFDGLIDYLRNIKTDLLNVIDSVTAGIHVFDLFTERFPWVKSLCLFAFALIIFSRFVGL